VLAVSRVFSFSLPQQPQPLGKRRSLARVLAVSRVFSFSLPQPPQPLGKRRSLARTQPVAQRLSLPWRRSPALDAEPRAQRARHQNASFALRRSASTSTVGARTKGLVAFSS